MKNVLKVTLVLGALSFVLLGSYGCGKLAGLFGGGSSEEVATEEAAPAEEAAAEGGGGGGSGCDAYAKCCMAYADALSKVSGIPAASIDAQKEACKSIETMKTMPGADTSCNTALDAMKSAGEAYKSMPGFTWPDACK